MFVTKLPSSTTAIVSVTNEFAAPTLTGYPLPTFSATGLPAGLTINSSTGVISGIPTLNTSAVVVVVTATNSLGSATFNTSMRVPNPSTIASFTNQNPRLNVTFSFIVSISGPVGDSTIVMTGLPPGLTYTPVSSAVGTIGGKATAVGTYNITLTLTTSGGYKLIKTAVYTVT